MKNTLKYQTVCLLAILLLCALTPTNAQLFVEVRNDRAGFSYEDNLDFIDYEMNAHMDYKKNLLLEAKTGFGIGERHRLSMFPLYLKLKRDFRHNIENPRSVTWVTPIQLRYDLNMFRAKLGVMADILKEGVTVSVYIKAQLFDFKNTNYAKGKRQNQKINPNRA